MVFQGFMSLGGTEIINQARTSAYTAHALPKLDLRECEGCDDFNEVLGHRPYQSPLVDQPDWYDETNPDSWDFYGLYPLDVQGFDDGVTTVSITELMQDGASVSVPRRDSRQMRVTGLLVGRTDAAISYGMVWLRNALLGSPCNSQLTCTGDHLCYFTACPPICSDSPDFGGPGEIRDCENGVVLDPISQCTAPYERILYDVTLVDGPRVVEQFPSDCANYVRVEFTLVAATPSPVGIARRVVSPGDLVGPAKPIPEISCTADGGVTTRRNFMVSPKIARNQGVGEWVWGVKLDDDRYDVDWEPGLPTPDGVALREIVRAGDGTARMSQLDEVGVSREALSDPVPLIQASPGLMTTASVYAKPSRDATASIWFDYVSAKGKLLGQTPVGTLDIPASQWGRVAVTFRAPGGTALLVGHAAMDAAGGNAQVGDMTWWAAGLLEYGSQTLDYFDGDTADTEVTRYRWSRRPNYSTSVAQRVVDNMPIIVDPDCTKIPDPPRAPLIDDECLREPAVWTRYQYVLDEDLVPMWSDALPVVSIRAKGEPVKQARVRFYPNPLDLDLAELEPCDFCGEFIISYIPSWATLTVDAIRQRAYVTSRGGIVRPASHLLYASDGGPMVWSSLSCGMQYKMTVDTVPTDEGTLSTTLCIAARE
jgi:hypothetical protein